MLSVFIVIGLLLIGATSIGIYFHRALLLSGLCLIGLISIGVYFHRALPLSGLCLIELTTIGVYFHRVFVISGLCLIGLMSRWAYVLSGFCGNATYRAYVLSGLHQSGKNFIGLLSHG